MSKCFMPTDVKVQERFSLCDSLKGMPLSLFNH